MKYIRLTGDNISSEKIMICVVWYDLDLETPFKVTAYLKAIWGSSISQFRPSERIYGPDKDFFTKFCYDANLRSIAWFMIFAHPLPNGTLWVNLSQTGQKEWDDMLETSDLQQTNGQVTDILITIGPRQNRALKS